jgi:hypothetical protein
MRYYASKQEALPHIKKINDYSFTEELNCLYGLIELFGGYCVVNVEDALSFGLDFEII